MAADEMRRIGAWMLAALQAPGDVSKLNHIRGEVADLCRSYPVPGIV
jgi:glycine hydroxymethyltransferase